MKDVFLISHLSVATVAKKVRHHDGFPAALNIKGGASLKDMHLVAKLMIEKSTDGTFLYRLSNSSRVIADTWHLSIEDAKNQANYEFDGIIGPWCEATKEEVGFIR